ncbi:DUF4365 domain-containing protein [Burkholderia ubonensis]|uniref:DUF4365 domain-containing protein n=1 Tax=Burkholderia ubonensis TaxID=101571 RepID=UPI000AF1674F|nr:DUF4365 domain-containing protein [Burkholderia ubonensis]
MAKDSRGQKIGRRGHGFIRRVFEDLGYICNDITEDFGEDFFVYGEDEGVVEPFKIFVQAKGSEAWDRKSSDWTEYCDPLTVRNWILSNELTIVVRANLRSSEARYAIPEDECEYWAIDYKTQFPIRLLTPFDEEAAERLIWIARIRHYDRLFRITMPNSFEVSQYQDVPRFRTFLLEFLVRLRIFSELPFFIEEFVRLYIHIFDDYKENLYLPAAEDMTERERMRYATCFTAILMAIEMRSGLKLEVRPYFIDQLACLLVQFAIEAEEVGQLPS